MKKIEKLAVRVEETIHDVATSVDTHDGGKKGQMCLRVTLKDKTFFVEWKSPFGFGLHNPASHAYGDPPEHTSRTMKGTLEQLLALFA